MQKSPEALQQLLSHALAIGSTDQEKHDIVFAFLSTINAQLHSRIPVYLDYSGICVPKTDFKAPQNQIFKNAPTLHSTNQTDCPERKRAHERIGDFNWKESSEWKTICDLFKCEPTQAQILSLAKHISIITSISLDRDAKRRKSVLIKWFSEHWGAISVHLPSLIPNLPLE